MNSFYIYGKTLPINQSNYEFWFKKSMFCNTFSTEIIISNRNPKDK